MANFIRFGFDKSRGSSWHGWVGEMLPDRFFDSGETEQELATSPSDPTLDARLAIGGDDSLFWFNSAKYCSASNWLIDHGIGKVDWLPVLRDSDWSISWSGRIDGLWSNDDAAKVNRSNIEIFELSLTPFDPAFSALIGRCWPRDRFFGDAFGYGSCFSARDILW